MSPWLKHRRVRGLLRAGTTSSYTLSHSAPCQRVLQCAVIVLGGIRLVFLRSRGTSTAKGRGAVRNATTRRSLIKPSRKKLPGNNRVKLPGNNRVVIAVRWCRFFHAGAVVHAPLLTRLPRLAPVNYVASLMPTACDCRSAAEMNARSLLLCAQGVREHTRTATFFVGAVGRPMALSAFVAGAFLRTRKRSLVTCIVRLVTIHVSGSPASFAKRISRPLWANL